MKPRRLEFSDVSSPADIIAPPSPTPATPVQVLDATPAPIENYFRFAHTRGEFDLDFAANEWDRQREEIGRLSMENSALQEQCDRLASELQTRTTTSNLYSRICDDNRDELNRVKGDLSAALIEIGQIEGKYDRLMITHADKCTALDALEVEHRNLIRALSEVSGRLTDFEYANSILQQRNTGQSDELAQLRVANECLSKRLDIAHARIGALRADKLALSAAVESAQRHQRLDEEDDDDDRFVDAPPHNRKKQVARISTGCRRPRDEIPPVSSPATPVLSQENVEVVIPEASPVKKARSE